MHIDSHLLMINFQIIHMILDFCSMYSFFDQYYYNSIIKLSIMKIILSESTILCHICSSQQHKMVCRSIGAISLCYPLLVFWESDIIELTFDISAKVSLALLKKIQFKIAIEYISYDSAGDDEWIIWHILPVQGAFDIMQSPFPRYSQEA